MTTVSLDSGGNASGAGLVARPETYDEPVMPDGVGALRTVALHNL